MSKLLAAGQLLATDAAARTLRFKLLPFGEVGNTNLGKVTASAHTLTIPAAPLLVNEEHDATKPLGTMVTEELEDGLECVVTVLPTEAGDAALAAAASGKRACISVEIDNPIIRLGKLLAGILSGSGLVEKPAFPSAMLMASDIGNPTENEEPLVTEEELAALAAQAEADAVTAAASAQAVADATASAAGDSTDAGEPDEDKLAASAPKAPAAPGSLLNRLATMAGKGGKLNASAPKIGVTLDQMTSAMFGLNAVTDPTLKAAAFDVVTQADMYDPTSTPQYLEELWKGRVRPQLYAPLLNTQSLTSMVVEGWDIDKKPTFGDWDPAYSGAAPAETMNDIHTNEVTFTKQSWTAKRLARGSRFDRQIIDFPNPAAMAVFLREETQGLSDMMDAKSKAFILATAKTVTANGSDKLDPWAKLIFGIANALEYSTPTYGIIGNDLWRGMQNTAEIDRRAWIETQLGLEDGTLQGFKLQPARLSDATMNGRIVVGCKPAIDLHQPPNSPIRVDALELQKGAVDKAVFTYYLFKADPSATELGGVVEVVDGV